MGEQGWQAELSLADDRGPGHAAHAYTTTAELTNLYLFHITKEDSS